jgi:hypothetical protein
MSPEVVVGLQRKPAPHSASVVQDRPHTRPAVAPSPMSMQRASSPAASHASATRAHGEHTSAASRAR